MIVSIFRTIYSIDGMSGLTVASPGLEMSVTHTYVWAVEPVRRKH